jgi:TolB protein
MKYHSLNFLKHCLAVVLVATAANLCRSQDSEAIKVHKEAEGPGLTKPIPVSLEGFSGEVSDVLKFDLYVQGFSFVAPDAAQYQITGSAAGVGGIVTDKFAKKVILQKAYTGTNARRQAHAFANDIVETITGKKGIGLTQIAFKAQSPDGTGEIYVSDFDGHNSQPITHDNAIVARPAWAPGRLALYYTTYARGNPNIFYNNLSTGERRNFAKFSGLNTSAAVSPDGSKVAMILDTAGVVNVYVCNADGTNLKRLTTSEEDSSPCWSPDGQWICFATKIQSRRVLAKVPAGGGKIQIVRTTGAPNPTEPDWSPDSKWIAFTSQTRDFNICVVPADGSADPVVLAAGENPSWSANSRTLIFNHSIRYLQTLSVLDVFTKQVKDVGRIAGSDSEPAWRKDLNF